MVFTGDIKRIADDTSLYEEYYNGLSEYRRIKADRLKAPADKARSVGAGILLKRALEKLDINEKHIKYGTTEKGKPFIEDHPELHFNLSHSKNKVMCVLSDIEAGCDVEWVRDRKDFERKISNRFFSDEEKAYIESRIKLGKREGTDAFFTVWTLKESYIKYTGEGLSRAFNSFGVIVSDKEYYINNDDSVILKSKTIEDYKYALCIKKEGDEMIIPDICELFI